MTTRGEPLPAPDHTPREIIAALLHPAVIVGALGYFVDIYDLLIFLVVRKSSLTSLGYTGDQLVTQGAWLFNWQMGGTLLGGLLWGLLGDRFGRLKILFGSIILYSLANLANAFVHDLNTYALCRFLAGIGLAGELGGSITLVSEVLPTQLRGYGTMLVSAIGVLGAVVAGFAAHYFSWNQLYLIGGCLGLLLLFLRATVRESTMFKKMTDGAAPAFGSQLILLLSPPRMGRYLCCILIGLPCWYVIGLVIGFSPEFAVALHCTGTVTAGTAVAWTYGGISLGDVLSGAFCQFTRARKSILLLFVVVAFFLSNLFFLLNGVSPNAIYFLSFFLGISVGYWAVFVTVAAEHFGTNMRATVATTVPNFVRGAVIPITSLYPILKPHYGALHSGLALGWFVFFLALIGWFGLRETFHDDLDYLES
jgi:MFS transporter, putative metabolite:H+ symporter